jgi:hypothetical protein
LHGGKRKKELTCSLPVFLIANNEAEPTRRARKCERQYIC